MAPPPETVRRDVHAALAEDLDTPAGQAPDTAADLSATLIDESAVLDARVISRDAGVLCGRDWFDAAFSLLDPAVVIDWHSADGDRIAADTELCRVRGPARVLLSGERTALNFLQLLSGTATRTRRYVDAVAGTGVRILDTRKTVPGLRAAQKYAVACGGGTNHRMGLFDAILLKENHLAAAGGIAAAVQAARTQHPGRSVEVEVEVENLQELAEAVAAGADRALLDNFAVADLARAAGEYRERIELEASGNITLETIGEHAATGVHCISVGDLTKRVEPLDLSMRHTR